jgi:hypothetical protein
VFAQAAPDKPSRFIRVMILPRELIGKSSIQYVEEDEGTEGPKSQQYKASVFQGDTSRLAKGKPKSQQYKIYADAPISFAARK